MKTYYIDVHVLQSLPPGNVNRDQSGRPKTATYGGVERARVSSQAWKRATRALFLDDVSESERGLRTRRLPQLIAERLRVKAPELTVAESVNRATAALNVLGIKTPSPKPKQDGDEEETSTIPSTEYLIFLSNRQLDRIAELLIDDPKPRAAAVKTAADLDHGLEVALFGRMVANVPDMRVDAACQVAHAISTHAVRTQFDYFTAVDDVVKDDETGADMIGTIEFNSSTLYRYATINLTQLTQNLGSDEAAVEAVRAFVSAFAMSMPTGKQNTFANRTSPDAVVVTGQFGRPVNLVGAFEDAIQDEGHGYVTESARRLAAHAAEVEQAFGPAKEFAVVSRSSDRAAALDALGERVSFHALVDGVVHGVRSAVSPAS